MGDKDDRKDSGTQYYQASSGDIPPEGGEGAYGSSGSSWQQGDQQYGGQQGGQQYGGQYGDQQYGQYQPYNTPMQGNQQMYDEVPQEIRRWNWGAFMFNWVWGIGNHAYLALLCFVPLLNIVWVFVCGAMGNQWAWRSGEFKDVETFLRVQRTWSRAGLVSFIVAAAGILLSLLMIPVLGAMMYNIWNATGYI
ncbi:MAG: hypothetical protein LBD12_03180 [Clostridiales Family XIII bacterium]|jgi:hypothetical protein|nr:hypothetical protein [Clostridiales Family XIII bacterium]